MALILKANKTYKDKYGGEHDSVYVVVKDVICNKHKETANIIIAVYASKQAKTDGKDPYDTISFICKNREVREEDGSTTLITDFTDYLSPEAVQPELIDQYQKAYEFVLTQREKSGFNQANYKTDEI